MSKYYQDNIKELNLPDCISVEEFDKISNHGIIPEGHFLCVECFLNISKNPICPECDDLLFHTEHKTIKKAQKEYHEVSPILKEKYQHDFTIDDELDGKFTTMNSHCYHIRRKYDQLHWYIPQNIPVSLAQHVIVGAKTVMEDIDTREVVKVYHGIKNYLMPSLKLLSKLEPYSDQWEKVYKNLHKKVMFLYNPKFLLRFGTVQNKYLSTNKSRNQKSCHKVSTVMNEHLYTLVEYASDERKINKAHFIREVLYDYFKNNGYIK